MSRYADESSPAVVVTDMNNHTITLLNGETGEVITRRCQEQGKQPRGVTTETAGFICVCYNNTNEVAVLSKGLSEEKIILSERDGLSVLKQLSLIKLISSFLCRIILNRKRTLIVCNYCNITMNPSHYIYRFLRCVFAFCSQKIVNE